MDLSSLFSWATDISELSSNSLYAQFYKDYFIESSVCGEVFGIGVAIAILVSAAFYFGIGNFVYQLSKRIVWGSALLMTGAVVFFVSESYIVGVDAGDVSASTGLYLSSYQTEDSLTKELKSDKAKPIHKKAQAYRDEFREGIVTLPEDIAIINMIYALLFFIGLSFAFKSHTTHAKAIPV